MAEFDKSEWERYATAYDTLNSLRPYVAMVDDVVAALDKAEYPLLDAGCGTGNLVQQLASISAGEIIGVDSTDAMLERARRKCPRIRFQNADLNQPLPFDDDMFATVVCVNALYAMENPERTLLEFRRVLRPQGLLVVVTPKRGYENGLMLKAHSGSEKPDSYWLNMHASPEREEALIREAIRDPADAHRFIEVARFNRRIRREGAFHFFEADELSHLVDECGFAEVNVKLTYADQNLLLTAIRSA